QLVDDENLQMTFVSIPYFFHNTDLKHSSTHLDTYTSITKAFIDYLEKTYKKMRHRSSS
ncbi:unnamed protein product, partial [Rotaria magnacalcarata]